VGKRPMTAWDHEAAKAAGGLPVYSDMSGTLLITEAGEIVWYDAERSVVEPMDDPLWVTVALVSASRQYPSLGELRPSRPTTAGDCKACDGTGAFKNMICGKCGGTGWLPGGDLS
jgi:hypothetical protein